MSLVLSGSRRIVVLLAFCENVGLGVEALDARDFPRAREIALRAVRECPDQFLAHDLLGRAALACGLMDEAAAAFAAVLRCYPGSFAARRHLGMALERLGRVEEAHAA